MRKLLALIDAGKEAEAEAFAAALGANIGDYLPADPAGAMVLAKAMAEKYAEAWEAARKEKPEKPENPDNPVLANSREYKREQNGQFSEVDHPSDHKPGINPDSPETQAAEIGKGKKAIDKCIAEKRDVPDAVSRGDIGIIGFRYGDDKGGLAHFSGRTDTLQHLAETIVRGEAGNPYQNGQKLNIKNGAYTAVLTLTNPPDAQDHPKRWILTAFGPEDRKGSH